MHRQGVGRLPDAAADSSAWCDLSRSSHFQRRADLLRLSSGRRDRPGFARMGCVDFWRHSRREHSERFRQQLRQADRWCTGCLDARGLRFRSRLRAARGEDGRDAQRDQPGPVPLRGPWRQADPVSRLVGRGDSRARHHRLSRHRRAATWARSERASSCDSSWSQACITARAGPARATSVRTRFLRPGDQPSTSLAAALEAGVEQGRVPEQVIARQSPQFGTANSPARQNRTDMCLPKACHAQARS